MGMLSFFHGKRVLVTGHTGFKGAWLCRLLQLAGADLTGYATPPPTNPALFEMADIAANMRSIIGDIRDFDKLSSVFAEAEPEVVFHLAAQPIVRESYRIPRETYDVNVMGTVNLLEAVRKTPSVRSVVVITTDKVYENKEWAWGYRENERLDGFDPYSGSKSCAELVAATYRRCFFARMGVALSTARAGNVLGGGDFSPDRIMPDLVRAALAGSPVSLRNPFAVRPYQHVLDPLFAYLLIAKRQWENQALADSYNVGPDEKDALTTGELADRFISLWGGTLTRVDDPEQSAMHEAGLLRLDTAKLRQTLGWRPRWAIDEAIFRVVEFTRALAGGECARDMIDRQIKAFMVE